jgi:hypothetical protein
MFFIGRCRVEAVVSTLFCALTFYCSNVKYVFIITIALFLMGCGGCTTPSNHSNTPNYSYDISVSDGKRAYIYLKQRVNTVRLNSIADSCFHEYMRDAKDTFKVSFLYWDDGKYRSPFAEKIWVYDYTKGRFLEHPIKKIARILMP